MNYIYPNKQILEKRSSELGNAERYYSLSKMIFERDFKEKLLFPLGIDNEKEKYYINLIDKSGLFISGETGSGKSIFLNDIVISLLLKNSPEELQLVFVDPRNVEFNNYWHRQAQLYWEKNIGTRNAFLARYRRNYLK